MQPPSQPAERNVNERGYPVDLCGGDVNNIAPQDRAG